MSDAKRALITGIDGQDGSYLAELLCDEEYEVHGLVRRAPDDEFPRLALVRDRVSLHWGDLLDEGSLARVIRRVQPTEIYNLAAAAYVPVSFDQPTLAADVTGLGATRMLHATLEFAPTARFFQATSGEIFGRSDSEVLDEGASVRPANPYGAAKAYAHSMVGYFRELRSARKAGLWCCAGIAFNHESPRRGLGYVTRKITHAAAAIKHGEKHELRLGNRAAVRDWGFAKEYVEAMCKMLRQDEPEDYVLATGVGHTVQDVVDVAFARVGLDPEAHVAPLEDARPLDIDRLVGDPSKAADRLGWQASTSFESLIEMMVDHDLRLIEGGLRSELSGPALEAELIRAS